MAKQLTPNERTMQRWKEVKTEREALDVLLANWQYIGDDPYYRDFNDALYEMVERILAEGISE
jgi:hypothetical protein